MRYITGEGYLVRKNGDDPWEAFEPGIKSEGTKPRWVKAREGRVERYLADRRADVEELDAKTAKEYAEWEDRRWRDWVPPEDREKSEPDDSPRAQDQQGKARSL